MAPLVEKNLDLIRQLCATHFIKRLYLFGSAARNELNEKSDLDFLYEMDTMSLYEKNPDFDFAGNFWALEEALEAIFQRPVQLVPVSELKNKYLIQSITKDKTLLYAAA